MGKKKGKKPDTGSGSGGSTAPLTFAAPQAQVRAPEPSPVFFPPLSLFPREQRVTAGITDESSREAEKRTQERLANLQILLAKLAEKLEDKGVPDRDKLLELKSSVLNTLEVLIKLRENFKRKYYNRLIQETDETITPIKIIRNFIVHSDTVLMEKDRYYAYHELALALIKLKNLMSGQSDTPIDLKKLDHYSFFESCYIPVEIFTTNKASVYQRSNDRETCDLIDKGFARILSYSKNLSITQDTTIDELRNSHIKLLMTIAEVAEIFRQLPSDATVRVKDKPLDLAILPYFMQIRNAMFHYPLPFQVTTVQAIIVMAKVHLDKKPDPRNKPN